MQMIQWFSSDICKETGVSVSFLSTIYETDSSFTTALFFSKTSLSVPISSARLLSFSWNFSCNSCGSFRADTFKNCQIIGGPALFTLIDQPDINTFSIGIDAEIPGTLKERFCAAFWTVSDDFIRRDRCNGPCLLL